LTETHEKKIIFSLTEFYQPHIVQLFFLPPFIFLIDPPSVLKRGSAVFFHSHAKTHPNESSTQSFEYVSLREIQTKFQELKYLAQVLYDFDRDIEKVTEYQAAVRNLYLQELSDIAESIFGRRMVYDMSDSINQAGI